MQITFCLNVEFGPKTLGLLRELLDVARSISQKETVIMKSLTDLQADVAAETAVASSAVTLLGGLSAQIAALKTTQTDPATAAAIDALANQIESSTADLAAAVTANTPAAPDATS